MATKWEAACVDCETVIGYSAALYSDDRALGLTRPVRCLDCENHFRREKKAVVSSQVRFCSPEMNERIESLGESPFGSLPSRQSLHKLIEQTPTVKASKYPEIFGLQPEELHALYSHLLKPDVPVVVAVAPTGSGKSTYLPFRLLNPLPFDGVPSDAFTRFGQIVVTQPRVAPTREIPQFVSGGLHGQDCGIGWDIGFRYSGNRSCDWRNKMIYVTDGTLVNWITNGDLDKIGLIMIDEAHERSLNIDVILGLLTRAISDYPHLKVVIASATIDEKKFETFFNDNLAGSMRCEIVSLSGKTHKGAGYTTFFRNEITVPGSTEPEPLPELDYQREVPREFGAAIAAEVADQALRILKHTFKVDGFNGFAPDGNPVLPGDIVCFLHGKKAIDETVALIDEGISMHPKIAALVDVYPLYREVDDEIQKKAIGDKEDLNRMRVIVSSNMAETSLTIDGIVHVVDSGIINQKRWYPELEDSKVLPYTHSKAGCKQRWGRAGRKQPGQAWCLYSRKQYDDDKLFITDTIPDIERSALDPVVMSAKLGGGDKLTDGAFPWIGAPAKEEFEQAIYRLSLRGALDDSHDPTEFGAEMRGSNEDALATTLLSVADRFGCSIEMATVLPMMQADLGKLLPYDKNLDEATRGRIARAQDALRKSCDDDLELCLKLFANWQRAQSGGPGITSIPEFTASWRPETLKSKLPRKLGRDRIEQIHKTVRACSTVEDLRRAGAEFVREDKSVRDWFDHCERAFSRLCAAIWAQANGVDEDKLRSRVETERDAHIEQLGAAKRENERRDVDFDSVERLRIVFTWCLRDSAFVIDDPPAISDAREFAKQFAARNLRGGRVRYTPWTMDEEDHENPAEISRWSAAAGKPVAAFVTLGPKRFQNRNGQSEVREVSCVIKTNPELLEQLHGLDEMGLTLFMLDRVKRSAEQIGDSGLAVRLLLDQVYPRGAWARCRILDRRSDGSYKVEVIEPVASESSKEPTTDITKLDGRRRNKKKRRGGTDRYVREGNIKVYSATDVEPSNDLDWDATQDSDAVTPDHSTDENATPAAEATNSSRLVSLLRKRRLRGRLSVHDKRKLKRDEEIEAEIVGHSVESDNLDDVGIVLSAPGVQQKFEQLVRQKKLRVGATIRVRPANDNRTSTGRHAEAVLLEKTTGAECRIAATELGLMDKAHVVEGLNPHDDFDASIIHIDEHSSTIEVSTRSALEDVLAGLAASDAPIKLNAKVVDKDRNNTWVHVDTRTPGVVLPARIRAVENDDDNQTVGADAGPRIGAEIEVLVRFNDRSRWRFRRRPESLDACLTDLEEWGFQWKDQDDGGLLFFRGRMSLRQRNEFREQVGDREMERAIDRMFADSNTLEATAVVKDIARLFPLSGKTEGTIQNINRDGLTLALKAGVAGFIPAREINWFSDRPHLFSTFTRGEKVSAKITSVDPQRQQVELSRKQLSENPWFGEIPQKFPVGTWTHVRVDGVTDDAIYVELQPELKTKIQRSDLGSPPPQNPADVFSVGQSVSALVTRIDANKHRVYLTLVDRKAVLRERFPVGSTHEGRVKNVREFGAFVDIGAGTDGFLHVSELSYGYVEDANDHISTGERVLVRIQTCDLQNDKIALKLIRRLEEDEQVPPPVTPSGAPLSLSRGGVTPTPQPSSPASAVLTSNPQHHTNLVTNLTPSSTNGEPSVSIPGEQPGTGQASAALDSAMHRYRLIAAEFWSKHWPTIGAFVSFVWILGKPLDDATWGAIATVFFLLSARCKPGFVFSLAPAVYATIVLVSIGSEITVAQTMSRLTEMAATAGGWIADIARMVIDDGPGWAVRLWEHSTWMALVAGGILLVISLVTLVGIGSIIVQTANAAFRGVFPRTGFQLSRLLGLETSPALLERKQQIDTQKRAVRWTDRGVRFLRDTAASFGKKGLAVVVLLLFVRVATFQQITAFLDEHYWQFLASIGAFCILAMMAAAGSIEFLKTVSVLSVILFATYLGFSVGKPESTESFVEQVSSTNASVHATVRSGLRWVTNFTFDDDDAENSTDETRKTDPGGFQSADAEPPAPAAH